MSTVDETSPADTTDSGLSPKGLSAGKVGIIGGAIVGVSCIAPAYTLTSGLGPTISEVGFQVPAVLLIGFVPMLLVLFGYRELNTAMPDSGTSFTWATRAFGPWVGWMTGWGLIAATVLVLSNLAAVAVDFLFVLLAQVFDDQSLVELSRVLWLNVLLTFVFTAIAAYISYRGVETTQKAQTWLVGFQLLALSAFVVVAFIRIANGEAYDYTPISLDWFNPVGGASLSALVAGVSLSIFLFWGWDTVITMNEEAKDPERTPGRASMLTILVIVTLYLVVAVAVLAYAGIGKTGLGAGNPENQESLFAVLAAPILGPFAVIISIAILSSSAASLQSTMLSPSRTMLAMGHYGAMPPAFRRVSPRFKSPSVATFVAAGVSVGFYAVMRVLSENALWDTVTALGLMVCFYYGITGLAAVWYFRRTWLLSGRNIAYRLVMPLLGGLTLIALFFKTAVDSFSPSYGSGSALFASDFDADGMPLDGVGLVFVTGVGILLLGVAFMVFSAVRHPAFFRGEIIHTGAADPDYPVALDALIGQQPH